MKELSSFGGIGTGKGFHLGEDVEELSWWEGIERAGDRIRACEARRKVNTQRKRWESGVVLGGHGRGNWYSVGRHCRKAIIV